VAMRETQILEAAARLDDDAALDRMTESIHEGDRLRALLKPGFTGRMRNYDQETRIARYVVVDGAVVLCFTETQVSREEAARIAVECNQITEWDSGAFRAAASRVLGEFDLIS